jgi:hypothetical protein
MDIFSARYNQKNLIIAAMLKNAGFTFKPVSPGFGSNEVWGHNSKSIKLRKACYICVKLMGPKLAERTVKYMSPALIIVDEISDGCENRAFLKRRRYAFEFSLLAAEPVSDLGAILHICGPEKLQPSIYSVIMPCE